MRGHRHAATERRLRGVLAAALVAAAIAIPSASAVLHPVIFGTTFTINGQVPTGKAGETVQVLARPYGQSKYGSVGVVTTGTNGNWTFKSRPRISTTYLGVWRGNMTTSLSADVTPRLDLALRNRVLTVTARAANSLQGHSLVVQVRKQGTAWHNVRTIALGPGSRAQVPFTAPHGRSEIRLYLSKAQAGAGYIGGFSGILLYRNAA